MSEMNNINGVRLIDSKLSMYWSGALGYSLPPVIPFRNIVTAGGNSSVETLDPNFKRILTEAAKRKYNFQVPMSMKLEGGAWWDFPLDPLVSVSSKNIITRRYVAKSKARGSIKERWSQDDWEISITGLIQSDVDGEYPQDYLQQLMKFCDAKETIEVSNLVLGVLNIDKIVIESYDLPFTVGSENQGFTIKAYSDDIYTLLVEDV